MTTLTTSTARKPRKPRMSKRLAGDLLRSNIPRKERDRWRTRISSPDAVDDVINILECCVTTHLSVEALWPDFRRLKDLLDAYKQKGSRSRIKHRLTDDFLTLLVFELRRLMRTLSEVIGEK